MAGEARFDRSGRLMVCEPPWSGPFKQGRCCWCGEEIVLLEGAHHAMRQRTRHRGDKWEAGKRDCDGEFRRSVCWSARDLVKLRGDPACVDCGSTGEWDADHHIPLWEGGEHVASNIVRRCEPCHKRKTAEEAGRRAGKVSGEVHDEQLALATSGEES